MPKRPFPEVNAGSPCDMNRPSPLLETDKEASESKGDGSVDLALKKVKVEEEIVDLGTCTGLGKSGKRLNYISWDLYFISLSFLSAMRSKDPNTQVGAVIVDSSNKILSIGYNGMPRGVHDDEVPWNREEKYNYVVHAELNAVLNCQNNSNLQGSRIYVSLFPCCECSKALCQVKIKEVIYVSDKYHDTPSCRASRRILDLAGVKYTKFTPPKELVIDFSKIEAKSS